MFSDLKIFHENKEKHTGRVWVYADPLSVFVLVNLDKLSMLVFLKMDSASVFHNVKCVRFFDAFDTVSWRHVLVS